MKQSKSKIAGWVLSIFLAVFLGFVSAYGKFFDFPNKEEMFAKMGWATEVMVYVGMVEVAISAILISAYLGGATAAHVRVNEPFVFPIFMGVIAWVALGLRDPRVFKLAFQTAAPALDQ
jgi:hypothetical protein